MPCQTTFKRYELKYLLTLREKREYFKYYERAYEAGFLWTNHHTKYLF